MSRETPVPEFWDDRESVFGDPTLAGQDHPLREAFEKLFEEFDETERELLTMSLIGNLSVRRIAEFIGLSKSEVGRRLNALGLEWHVGEYSSFWKFNEDSELSAIMKEITK